MRVMTVLGTRPEIIRLSLIIKKLDEFASGHILVHTGQNYDQLLSDVFFQQMNVRTPNYHLNIQAHSFGKQIGHMFEQVEQLIYHEKPDVMLVLGDTNSALCAILGARLQIPVYHMEAGNRCYDPLVPEETNRKIIDSISSFNLPYTPGSRENLLREGMAPQRIWVSGNPIYEVIQHYRSETDSSAVLQQLGVREREYLLVTAHRAENVDNEERLKEIFTALNSLADEWQMPVICSVHPRTRERLQQSHLNLQSKYLKLCRPFGFFDFIQLQKHARCVLTDSGTVQEESCLFHVPSVTVRQSTERPETVICGSNIVSGVVATNIMDSVRLAMKSTRDWPLPEGYEDTNVSMKVIRFILGGVRHV